MEYQSGFTEGRRIGSTKNALSGSSIAASCDMRALERGMVLRRGDIKKVRELEAEFVAKASEAARNIKDPMPLLETEEGPVRVKHFETPGMGV